MTHRSRYTGDRVRVVNSTTGESVSYVDKYGVKHSTRPMKFAEEFRQEPPYQKLRQPNDWSCLPTAFAIILGVSYQEMVQLLGHDGSDIIWKELPSFYSRRCFHIQEMVNACYRLGKSVTPFEPVPCTVPLEGQKPHEITYDFMKIFESNHGVLTGENLGGVRHAVAWTGDNIINPASGKEESRENFVLEVFWCVC